MICSKFLPGSILDFRRRKVKLNGWEIKTQIFTVIMDCVVATFLFMALIMFHLGATESCVTPSGKTQWYWSCLNSVWNCCITSSVKNSFKAVSQDNATKLSWSLSLRPAMASSLCGGVGYSWSWLLSVCRFSDGPYHGCRELPLFELRNLHKLSKDLQPFWTI